MKSLQTLSRKIFISMIGISIMLSIIYGSVYGVNKLGGLLFRDESILCLRVRSGRGRLNSLVVTPDGKTIIAGEKQIRFWDIATGKKRYDTTTLASSISSIFGASFSVSDLVITPDQQTLISATSTLGLLDDLYEIQIWDLANRQKIRTLTNHTDRIRSLFVSPDSQTLLSEDNSGVIQFWDLSTGQVKKTLNTQKRKHSPIVLSPDGRIFASIGKDGTVAFWDIETGNSVGKMKADPSHTPLAISSDNKTLLIQNAGDVKRFREIETGVEKQIIKGSYIEDPFAITPNGKQILIQTDAGIKLYDMLTGAEVKVFNNTESDNKIIDVSPDGKSFITADAGGKYILWDLATGVKVHQLEGRSERGPHGFTPDAKILVSANTGGNRITLWDLDTGKRIRRFCNL